MNLKIPATRTSSLTLRMTQQQEAALRRAAGVSHKSLTRFILDSACQSAEQILLDQRLFRISASQSKTLLQMLDRPARVNAGLKDLFSRKAPW